MNEDPAEVVRRWIAALSDHDLNAAADCFAADYFDEAPARLGESVHGRDAVRTNFQRLFSEIPDVPPNCGTVPSAATPSGWNGG